MKILNFLLAALAVGSFKSANAATSSKGSFVVKVERVDQSTSTDSIQLRGTISARSSFSSIKVFWVLPEDVVILGGQPSINSAIQKGETQTYEITVKAHPSENRKIHFIVNETVENDGTNLGGSAQYNTYPKRDADVGAESLEVTTKQNKSRNSSEGEVNPRKKMKKPKRIIQ